MLDGLPDDTAAGTHPVQALVSSVGSASVEAMDTALWGFSDEQIATLVVEHDRSARQFAALGMALVRQADRCDAGKALGAISTPDWLRDSLRLLPGEAKSRVGLAAGLDVDAAALYCAEQVFAQHDADIASGPHHAGYPVPNTEQVQGTTTTASQSDAAGVRRSPLALAADAVEALAVWAGQLPCTAAGVRTGRLSIKHAEVIARHLRNLPAGLDPVTVADAEAFLATQALQVDPGALGRIGSHLVTTLTRRETVPDDHDDDASEDELSSDAKRREHAEALTFFTLTDQGDGTVRAAGCFSEEAADTVRTALEPLAAPQPTTDGTPDPRPYGKRQGDALVELARRSLDAGQPARHPRRAPAREYHRHHR